MKCLVTGASGLIGSHLVRRLARESETTALRALARGPSPDELRSLPRLQWMQGDVRDAAICRQALQGVTHVFHCAGLVSDWGSRQAFLSTNLGGTVALAAAARETGVQRFIHLSSAAVYGYPRRGPIQESFPLSSRGIAYIESKIAAELAIRREVVAHQLPAVMLRPVMVFGPGSRHYVSEIVAHLRSGTMAFLDAGRHVAGLAYVENVVDACLLAAHANVGWGSAYNVCDDSPVTWKQYIERLAAGTGLPAPRWSLPTWLAYSLSRLCETYGRLRRRPHRPWLTRLAVLELGHPQRYDIGLARRHLQYEPRVGFESAMEQTLAWVRAG